ncbi:MAG: hypothetical protein IKV66_04540 [Clostridia bacterium]|nr:hypothetical protein [Clostridia bacterium]
MLPYNGYNSGQRQSALAIGMSISQTPATTPPEFPDTINRFYRRKHTKSLLRSFADGASETRRGAVRDMRAETCNI